MSNNKPYVELPQRTRYILYVEVLTDKADGGPLTARELCDRINWTLHDGRDDLTDCQYADIHARPLSDVATT